MYRNVSECCLFSLNGRRTMSLTFAKAFGALKDAYGIYGEKIEDGEDILRNIDIIDNDETEDQNIKITEIIEGAEDADENKENEIQESVSEENDTNNNSEIGDKLLYNSNKNETNVDNAIDFNVNRDIDRTPRSLIRNRNMRVSVTKSRK